MADQPSLIIDAHMHLWDHVHGAVRGETPVRPVADGVLRIGDDEVLGMPPTMHACRATAELFVAEMDAAGVSAAVVVQEYLDGEQNEYLLDVAARYPGRFFMHGLPDWFQPDNTAGEVETLLDNGFRGIKLPAMHLTGKVELDDPRYMPAYRQIEQCGAVLALDLSEGEGQVPAMRSVIDTHPSMKVAIGHFGMPTRGGWPSQLDLCRYENVYVELGGTVWLYREHGLRFEPALDALEQAIERIGPQKIMWGSDWPRTMVDFTYRQSLDWLHDTARVTVDDKAGILGGNARHLYGFGPSDAPHPHGPLPRITEG